MNAITVFYPTIFVTKNPENHLPDFFEFFFWLCYYVRNWWFFHQNITSYYFILLFLVIQIINPSIYFDYYCFIILVFLWHSKTSNKSTIHFYRKSIFLIMVFSYKKVFSLIWFSPIFERKKLALRFFPTFPYKIIVMLVFFLRNCQ